MVTFVASVDTAIEKSSASGDLQAGMWEAGLARASQGPLAGIISVTVVIVEHFGMELHIPIVSGCRRRKILKRAGGIRRIMQFI